MNETPPPVVLTIAGSDGGGGAGIQADLKTFTALQVFGATAITSITSQNTLGVHAVRDIPPDTIHSQIKAVMDDLKPAAVKSGMLSNSAIIHAVAEELERYRVTNYVLDPVMISESGHALLRPDAIGALTNRLVPLALIATPNAHEAEALTGVPVRDNAGMEAAARSLHKLGPKFVLVKGGHLPGKDAADLLFDGDRLQWFSAPRIDTRNTHGTGCTLAAAIAAYLAKGFPVPDAVREAKDYVTGAIQHSFSLGAGPGPLNHFWRTN